MKRRVSFPFCCIAASLLLAASTAQASDAGSGAASGLLQMIMSLLIVLAIIAAIAWGIKRMGGMSGMRGNSNTAVQIIGAGSVGPRERVVLVEVAGQWLVLGVAQGNVNLLATLPPQERPQINTPLNAAGLTPKFAEWLQRALAARKER